MTELDIAVIMNATDTKCERWGFDHLNEAERVVNLVSHTHFEIELGGFSGFYYNPSGDYATETVWAFQQIGISKVADILRRANALFPHGSPSRDRDTRYHEWQQLAHSVGDSLNVLTDEFYSESQNIDKAIEEYITAHWVELPESEE